MCSQYVLKTDYEYALSFEMWILGIKIECKNMAWFSWSQVPCKLSGHQLSSVIVPPIYNIEHWSPGGRLNKKDGLTRYGDSHVKDKTS